MHVLSTDPKQLKETYKYVCDNYGEDVLNKITSVLSSSIEVIQNVENLNIPFSNKKGNLTIAQAITFGFQSLNEVKRTIESDVFQKYPKLFTSQVLARTRLEEIEKIINSEAFRKYPQLFTSETLAQGNLEEIEKIINSEAFRKYPQLFTSTTLAYAKLEEIEKIIDSEAFRKYPQLFTSQVLAHARLEEIEKIIESDAFKTHPELFTSQALARAKVEDVSSLLAQSYWKDSRFSSLLSPTIVAQSKTMLKKIPELIKIAEEHEIDHYLSSSFLMKSPSQVYALIRHLEDNNIPLVTDNKLNPIFSCQPIIMKKRHGVDLKTLMKLYPYEKTNLEKEGSYK